MFRDKGIRQPELKETAGLLFVLRHADMELLKPAKFDDLIRVTTRITNTGAASLHLLQKITREEELLATIKIEVVCVSASLKPRRIPVFLREALTACHHKQDKY